MQPILTEGYTNAKTNVQNDPGRFIMIQEDSGRFRMIRKESGKISKDSFQNSSRFR